MYRARKSLALILFGALSPFVAGQEAAKLDFHGDPLPEGAVARIGSIRLRHLRTVTSEAFSPDGSILATSTSTPNAWLWETVTGKLLRRLSIGSSNRPDVYFATGGKSIIRGNGKAICFYDISTGQELRRFSVREEVNRLALSPDGTMVATGGAGDPYRVWDLADGQERAEFPWEGNYFGGMTWVPQHGKLAALGLHYETGWFCRLLDIRSGKETRLLTKLPKDSHAKISIGFSPDGKIAAVADGSKSIWLQDLATSKRIGRLAGHKAAVSEVLFSPDGNFLASVGGDDTVRLWRLPAGKETVCLNVPDSQVLAFSPNSKILVTSGNGHALRLWDVTTCRELVPHQEPVDAGTPVAFTPDGKTLLAIGDGLRFWDVATGKESRPAIKKIDSANAVLSGDGKVLAVATEDQEIELWNLATGKRVARFEPPIGNAMYKKGDVSGPQTLALSPDGKRIAVANLHETIAIYDLPSKKRLSWFPTSFRYQNGFTSIALSPDGKTLATLPRGSKIEFWNVKTGKPFRELEHGWNYNRAVAYSSDGNTLAASNDREGVRLWQVATGKVLHHFPGSVGWWPHSLRFLQGDTRLAITTRDGLWLWDLRTGKRLFTFQDPSGFLEGTASSRDGKRIATGSRDGTILIWDADYRSPKK